VPEEQFRTPAKKSKTQFTSPQSRMKSPNSRTQPLSSYRQRMMSPDNKTSKDHIYSLNEELFHKETEHLFKTAIAKDKLKS
jgi:hypothetical protein